jgi:plastocyanin
VLAVVTALGTGASAGTAAQASLPGHAAVTLRDIAFTPATVRVAKGATVTWTWRDGRVSHNVRSTGTRRFKGSPTKAAGTYRVRFTKAGTYRYECTIHLGMTGKVVVR